MIYHFVAHMKTSNLKVIIVPALFTNITTEWKAQIGVSPEYLQISELVMQLANSWTIKRVDRKYKSVDQDISLLLSWCMVPITDTVAICPSVVIIAALLYIRSRGCHKHISRVWEAYLGVVHVGVIFCTVQFSSANWFLPFMSQIIALREKVCVHHKFTQNYSKWPLFGDYIH